MSFVEEFTGSLSFHLVGLTRIEPSAADQLATDCSSSIRQALRDGIRRPIIQRLAIDYFYELCASLGPYKPWLIGGDPSTAAVVTRKHVVP